MLLWDGDAKAPGRRQRDEARGRIRTLLSMEAHVADEVEISERDITRVEKALKGNKKWGDSSPAFSLFVEALRCRM